MKSSKPGFIIVIPTYFSSQVSSLDCRYVCSQCHLTHVYTPLILSGPSQELLWDSVFLFNTYYVCSDHPTSYHLQSLCTGISDSRLFPLQYFLASTVDDGILCAWLFPPEDFKSLEGQDGIFLFIMYSRAWFLAYPKGSVRTSLVAPMVKNLPWSINVIVSLCSGQSILHDGFRTLKKWDIFQQSNYETVLTCNCHIRNRGTVEIKFTLTLYHSQTQYSCLLLTLGTAPKCSAQLC